MTAAVSETSHLQVSTMSPPVRDLLGLVTLLDGATVTCLVGAGATDPATVDLAIRHHVLRLVDDELSVAQPALGAALLEVLGDGGRRALHRRAAALPIDSVHRALHADLAHAPGPAEDLASTLAAAARRAGMIGDADLAARLAEGALRRTAPQSASRSGRVLDAAEAAFVAGHLTHVVTLLDGIDPTELSVTQLDRGVALMSDAMLRVHGRTWVLERARQLQDQLPVRSARWDLVEVVRLGFSDPDGARSMGALRSTSNRLDPSVAPYAAHAARVWQVVQHVDNADGLDAGLLEQLRALESTGHPSPVRPAVSDTEAALAHQCDDLALARSRLPHAVRHARAVGDVTRLTESLAHSVIVAVLGGSVPTARELLHDAEGAATALDDAPEALQRARGLLAVASDDRAALEAVLASPPSPATEARGDLVTAGLRGLDAAYSHDWATALPLLDRVRRDAARRGIHEPGRRLWVDAELGCALVHTGHLDRAREVASALADLGGRPGRVHALGQARRIEALIALRQGDPGLAVTMSDQAVTDLRAGGFLLQQLRAQTERLEALVALGDDRAVRLAHRVALSEATTAGDPRIVADLALLGPTAPSDDLSTLLTTAEHRVAEAVADGQSNRDIAARFFVSVRTVETQLSSIYRKTGSRTRTQLALRVLGDRGAGRPVATR